MNEELLKHESKETAQKDQDYLLSVILSSLLRVLKIIIIIIIININIVF